MELWPGVTKEEFRAAISRLSRRISGGGSSGTGEVAVPTGTGFRHVTSGAEDAAAKLVEAADVAAAAGIQESKLALDYPTHSPANDPTSGQKAALAGSYGTPGAGNPYVTGSDPRTTDARTPTAHALSHQSGQGDPIKLDDLAAPDDTTDLNASAAKHGLLPKLPNDTSKFLRGDGSWQTPTGLVTNGDSHDHQGGDGAAIAEAALSLSDVVTGNVSTTKHGFMSKLPNQPLQFYDGEGGWSEIVGSAGAIRIYSVAGTTTRNSNSTERSLSSSTPTKKKEVLLGEPVKGVRITFKLATSNSSYTAYGQIYRNGSPIGTLRSTNTVWPSYQEFSEDFNIKWDAGDLIQIYIWREYGGTAYISEMYFKYNRAVAAFGSWDLVTGLQTVQQTAYQMTNQDP